MEICLYLFISNTLSIYSFVKLSLLSIFFSFLFGLFLHQQALAQDHTIDGVPYETAIQNLPNHYDKSIIPPIPINLDDILQRIRYPKVCKKNRVEGKVIIRMIINTEGVPVNHVVKKAAHPAIADECIKVIFQLRYKPAIRFGKNASCWTSVPFDFKL
jgi:periplasmic protein TonB